MSRPYLARELVIGLNVCGAFLQPAGADHGEHEIAVLHRIVPAELGGAGVHDRGVGVLDRLRRQIALLDLEEAAFVVERVVLGPQPLDDGEPFLGAGVAVLVAEHRLAEHLDLGLHPAGDDVEDEAPIGDVVDRRRLLGGDDRMVDGDVRGRDHADLGHGSGDAGGPGVGLEARAPAGWSCRPSPASARPAPAPRTPSSSASFASATVFGPGDVEPAVEVGHHAAGVEIGLERAELQPAGAERRIGRLPVALSLPHPASPIVSTMSRRSAP